ncbi:cytochrome P450 [Frankia sp. BMG5.23]|uniref:cytochrome P450 n=2 Tax=unclassified Frankia TaxID=2632575 RepID=UPI002100A95B|nr:cytochrome P450 [Frankia sp. BMG5.23]
MADHHPDRQPSQHRPTPGRPTRRARALTPPTSRKPPDRQHRPGLRPAHPRHHRTLTVRKYRQLHALMHQLAEERRQDPRDDLITRLINANVDGDHLTRDELGKFFTLLIVAGAETARNALSHALALLTEHPEQRSTLLGDLPGRLPGAVEEVIRYATPTTWMRRTLVRPAELSGNVYQPGDRVVMFYNSANRDAAVFDAPDRFDITRDPNPHLGFGGPGPHWCLGAHLARHEITIMLKELLTRLPNVHVSGPAVRQRSSFSNGIKELPCSF